MFLAVWTALFAVALAALAVMAARPPTDDGGAFAMVGLWPADGDPPVVAAPVGREAAAAGIVHGDRLVAVDGVAVTRRAAAARLLAGPRGTAVTVDTMRAGGRRLRHRLTRDPVHLREGLIAAGLPPGLTRALHWALPLLSADLLPLAFAAMLLVARARDPLAPWASLMLVSQALSLGSLFKLLTALPAPWPGVASAINDAATAFGLTILILFPDGSVRRAWHWSIPAAVVVIGAAFGPTSVVTNAATLVLFVAAVRVVARRFRGAGPSTGRQQARWVVLGFTGSMVAFALAVLLLVIGVEAHGFATIAWTGLSDTVAVALYSVGLLAGIMLGLMHYRLYDADATISRSLVYGALTLALLAIFTASERTVEVLGQQYLGGSLGAVAGILGATAAAVMIGPLHHRVSHWVERHLQSGLVELRQGLPVLLGDMRETAGPKALADAALGHVQHGARAHHGAVLVDGAAIDTRGIAAAEAEGWWRRHGPALADPRGASWDRGDALFPMRLPLSCEPAGLVGWLLLGPRPDGSFYGKDERGALAAVAGPMARALAMALARERQAAEAAARDAALHARLDTLCDFLRERFGFDAAPRPPIPSSPRTAGREAR